MNDLWTCISLLHTSCYLFVFYLVITANITLYNWRHLSPFCSTEQIFHTIIYSKFYFSLSVILSFLYHLQLSCNFDLNLIVNIQLVFDECSWRLLHSRPWNAVLFVFTCNFNLMYLMNSFCQPEMCHCTIVPDLGVTLPTCLFCSSLSIPQFSMRGPLHNRISLFKTLVQCSWIIPFFHMEEFLV